MKRFVSKLVTRPFFSGIRKKGTANRAIALTLVLTGSFSVVLPHSAYAADNDNKFPHKSSFYAAYKAWSAAETIEVTIEPVSAQPAETAKVTSIRLTNSASNPASTPASTQASSDITDAEIFAQQDTAANDPLEPLNRAVFGFNEILDLIVFTPVSYGYRTIVPTPIRSGVANAIANAKLPVTFANNLLQGKTKKAGETFMRFLINTTVGLGGIVDAAQAGGFEKQTEDFGQTLAVWGVGSGPYLVAPVFGPTSPRHLVGRLVDTAVTPTTWALYDFSLLERSSPTIAELVSGHESIVDDLTMLRKTSPDFYASVRNIYRQSRKTAINDGEATIEDVPDLPDDLPID